MPCCAPSSSHRSEDPEESFPATQCDLSDGIAPAQRPHCQRPRARLSPPARETCLRLPVHLLQAPDERESLPRNLPQNAAFFGTLQPPYASASRIKSMARVSRFH